jgi:hypothetical protein
MMMLHCGGRAVEFPELEAVPLPEETNTYIPVPFGDLVKNTREAADDLLKDHTFNSAQYALAGKDQKMFAILQYNSDNEEMGYAIGIRSSYDKSMTNGFCIGAKVFVCDNMAFTGDVTYMRKHTKNVWNDLEEKLVTTIYSSRNKFKNILHDRKVMGERIVGTDQGYEFMGKLVGNNILKPRQMSVAMKCWKTPPYEDFGPRNMWSLYNACTEALKSTPPNKILEQHINLHNYATA